MSQVNRNVHSRPLSPSAEVVLAVLSPPLPSALRTPLVTGLAVSNRPPTYLSNPLIVYLSVDRHRLPVGHHTCLWYQHCLVLSPQQTSPRRHQAYRRSPGLLLFLLVVGCEVTPVRSPRRVRYFVTPDALMTLGPSGRLHPDGKAPQRHISLTTISCQSPANTLYGQAIVDTNFVRKLQAITFREPKPN